MTTVVLTDEQDKALDEFVAYLVEQAKAAGKAAEAADGAVISDDLPQTPDITDSVRSSLREQLAPQFAKMSGTELAARMSKAKAAF